MKKHKNIHRVILSLIVVLLILGGGIYYYAYHNKHDSSALTQVIRTRLHLPAASVDGTWIPFSLIDLRRDSARHFYENQDFAQQGIRIDFETPDGQKRLLLMEKEVFDKIIEDIVIQHLATQQNISISDEEALMELDRIIQENDAMFVQDRLQLYNFTKEQFAHHVVKNQLYRSRLEDWYNNHNTPTPEQTEKITQAQEALKNGTPFADVAKTYSQGATADKGGFLGFFKRGQLDPAIEDFAFTHDEGDVSDIIETPFGLHIVRIDNVLRDASESVESVSLRQIIIKKKSFASFLDAAIKQAHIAVWHPRYRWDAQTGHVLFRDKALDAFEQRILQEISQRTSL